MESTNTVDRMEQLYEVMLEHKLALKELVALRKHVMGDQTLEEEKNDEASSDVDFDPVMIANMKVILDGPILEFQTDQYTKWSSPVHALNKLSKWASRISFLHKDRQTIVRGLQAAQARIDGASKGWKDWDGIGELFDEDDGDKSNERASSMDSKNRPQDIATKSADGVTFTRPLSDEAKRVTQLDNYGLGSSRSAYSDLQSLTKVLKEQLEPYYSRSRLETEEFDYCLTTWVALQSLQPYVEDETLKDLMKMRNAVERMERLYDIMTHHKRTLQELAAIKCQEIRDCGEDCNGLF
jgi:hypothetical protein